eukprot:659309-Alexandrium_andersonii.AAC.1
MSASLVGSEMCIRDRRSDVFTCARQRCSTEDSSEDTPNSSLVQGGSPIKVFHDVLSRALLSHLGGEMEFWSSRPDGWRRLPF